jgi:ferredoxin
MSHIIKQPETEEEISSTKDAIAACPVAAIKE